MLQYVRVNFTEKRAVLINGKVNGETNSILLVDEATYRFSLGGLKNFQPASTMVQVTGTTSIDPLEINFSLVAAATAPKPKPGTGA